VSPCWTSVRVIVTRCVEKSPKDRVLSKSVVGRADREGSQERTKTERKRESSVKTYCSIDDARSNKPRGERV
jgi:hypothetical protein